MLKHENTYKQSNINYNCSILPSKHVNKCTLSMFLCILSIFFLVDKKKHSTFELLNKYKTEKLTLKPQNEMSKFNLKTPKLSHLELKKCRKSVI